MKEDTAELCSVVLHSCKTHICSDKIIMVYNCTIEKKGNMFIVQFPDMPNIQTFGYTKEEALAMAK